MNALYVEVKNEKGNTVTKLKEWACVTEKMNTILLAFVTNAVFVGITVRVSKPENRMTNGIFAFIITIPLFLYHVCRDDSHCDTIRWVLNWSTTLFGYAPLPMIIILMYLYYRSICDEQDYINYQDALNAG